MNPESAPPLPPRPISPFVSPSKSDALAECPHRYWQQQLHPTPDTRAQQIGRAYHEFMPLYVAACVMAKRQAMPEVVEECISKCGGAWHADWRDEVIGLCRATARDLSLPAGMQLFGGSQGRSPFEWEWAIKSADGKTPLISPDYTDPEAIAHGRIDCPALIPPGSGFTNATVWILDWKTGDWDPEEIAVGRDRIPKQRQPRYYLFAASLMFAADQFVWATFHPRIGKRYTATVKRAALAKSPIFSEMLAEHADLTRRLQLDREGKQAEAWPATPNKWCENCQFGPQKGNDTCPHYNAQQLGVSELRRKLTTAKNGASPDVVEIATNQKPENVVTTPQPVESAPVENQTPVAEPLPLNESAPSMPESVPADWQLSDDAAECAPRFKIFMFGDTGTYKTRSFLTVFSDRRPTTAQPRLAVIDTENGTEHYQREFRFLRKVTTKRENIVDGVLNPPPGVETVAIDSFTDFCDLVTEHWKAIYLVRERGAGNKRDYYTLQPRDYSNITEEIRKMVRALIDRADLNVIVTAKPKALYAKGELMQEIGETHDGFKRMPFFMDVILHLTKSDDGSVIAETKRDRTNLFPNGKWAFTPESFANVIEAAKQPPAVAEAAAAKTNEKTSESANGTNAPHGANGSNANGTGAVIEDAEQQRDLDAIKALIAGWKRIGKDDYRMLVTGLFGPEITSARQLDAEQRLVLIEELEALPPF